MISKIYDKVKNIIKENYKYYLVFIVALLILNYPLDYSIMVSRSAPRTDCSASKSKGSFNLAYVTELRGTISSVGLSYIMPSWTRVPLEEYQASSKESVDDINKRAKIYLEYSKQAAIKVAYEAANKSFNIKDDKYYIVYKSEETEGDIRIGDILLKVEGKKLSFLEEFRTIVESKNIGDSLDLTILRNDTEKQISVKIKEIEGQKLAGISILNLYDYVVDPSITLKFNTNESGSSGGLMMSLAIYDKLIDEDLTKGLKIVGTGTIDFYGNVGQIDGIKYKLKGAVKDDADVFLAPTGENYEECIKLKKQEKYDIEIIEVKDFLGTINSLQNLKK